MAEPYESVKIVSKSGRLTCAKVDLPDDNWRWAIVKDFKDVQDYGEILMAFHGDFEPSLSDLTKVLEALDS